MSKRLAAAAVPKLGPGKHTDGAGLFLKVQPSGSRSWIARVAVNGKRRDIGLGSYPEVSLADARRKCERLRYDAAHGEIAATPRERRAAMPTFGDCVERVHAENIEARRFASRGDAEHWYRRLEIHAAKLWGKRVDQVRVADVLEVLRPIWTDKHPTAEKVRVQISEIMQTAMVWFADDEITDPAGPYIARGLPKVRNGRNNQRAVHHGEVAAVLDAVDHSDTSHIVQLCLRFVALTGVRSAEAREARWSEIDGDVWTVPAERMKARRAHRVPLSRQALDVLDAARAHDCEAGLLFPSPQRHGRPLTAQALLGALERVGNPCTVHGFRSSLRSWAEEQPGVSWSVAESMIAHRLGDSTQSAYVRGDLLDERRPVMQAWADYLDGCES